MKFSVTSTTRGRGFEVCRFTSVLRDESSIRVEWCKRKIGE